MLSLAVVFLGDAASYAAEPTPTPTPTPTATATPMCTDEQPCVMRLPEQGNAALYAGLGVLVFCSLVAMIGGFGRGR